eukprot:1539657-Pyramimonas_sp.AAC.1
MASGGHRDVQGVGDRTTEGLVQQIRMTTLSVQDATDVVQTVNGCPWLTDAMKDRARQITDQRANLLGE